MFGDKKKIFILIGVVVAVFAGSLVVALFTGGGPKTDPGAETVAKIKDQPLFTDSSIEKLERLGPTENQLQVLIKQVSEERDELKRRRNQLDDEHRRLDMVRKEIQQQLQELANARMSLQAAIPAVKRAQAELRRERVVVRQEEQENLQRNAEIFARMQPDAAAEIWTRMWSDTKGEDVVKMLLFMPSKSAAKIIAELQDRTIAAKLMIQAEKIRKQRMQAGQAP